MALLDVTIPTDTELVRTYAGYIRALREKCNELESLIYSAAVFTSVRVSALSHEILVTENFVLADAAAGEQTFLLPNPADIVIGVEYKVKKIDATDNHANLLTYGTTKIDNADSVSLALPNEVITYVTDGENLWTV